MMNEPNDPFYISRTKIFIWGFIATAITVALVFLYVPKAPKNDALVAPLQGPGSDTGLLVPEAPVSLTPSVPLTASTQVDLAKNNYAKYCAQCHGPDGRAAGTLAKMMTRKPTNLVVGPFKYSRTAEGIAAIISQGVGTMPKFGNELGPEGSAQLAQFVLTLEQK